MVERKKASEKGAARLGREEKVCPDCGGPMRGLMICPNCRTDLTKRTSHKFLVLICVLALIGGAIFYLAAELGYPKIEIGGREVRAYLVDISGIDEGLNYGYVWIEGTVSSGPQYRIHPSVRLDFWVDDGTGEIRVRSYSEEAKTLAEENRIPGVGDHVKLFGWARIEDWGRRLDLQTKNEEIQLDIERQPAEESTIQDVVSDFPNQLSALTYDRVRVEGTVVSLRTLSAGFGDIFTIREENTGSYVDVFVHSGLENIGGELPEIKLMTKLRVTGGVSEYRDHEGRFESYGDKGTGSLQLVPKTSTEIEKTGQENLPDLISLSEVDDHLGELVGVQGKIVDSYEVSGVGRGYYLENAGSVKLWMYASVHGQIPPEDRDQLVENAVIRVYGFVKTYRGELQLQLSGTPEVPPEIEIVEGAA